jgi:hypothetical protein
MRDELLNEALFRSLPHARPWLRDVLDSDHHRRTETSG